MKVAIIELNTLIALPIRHLISSAFFQCSLTIIIRNPGTYWYCCILSILFWLIGFCLWSWIWFVFISRICFLYLLIYLLNCEASTVSAKTMRNVGYCWTLFLVIFFFLIYIWSTYIIVFYFTKNNNKKKHTHKAPKAIMIGGKSMSVSSYSPIINWSGHKTANIHIWCNKKVNIVQWCL